MAPEELTAPKVENNRPAIILVRPQLGENIGKAVRAMLNFSLTELRIVAPRDGWPNPAAYPAASGADHILDSAQIYGSVGEAIADCTLVLATTVRDRDMPKPVVSPEEAAPMLLDCCRKGEKPAILFGPERSGLTNDDVALADMVLTVPVNPEFGSLNLAQAVILAAYEFDRALRNSEPVQESGSEAETQAPKQELAGLMQQVEQALEYRGFFRSEDRRETQRRMLWNLFHKGRFSSQEIQTLRGIVKSLTRDKRAP